MTTLSKTRKPSSEIVYTPAASGRSVAPILFGGRLTNPAIAELAQLHWTRIQLPSGAWRFEHANGSVIYIGRTTTEAEIQHRLADAEAMIRRLQSQRARP